MRRAAMASPWQWLFLTLDQGAGPISSPIRWRCWPAWPIPATGPAGLRRQLSPSARPLTPADPRASFPAMACASRYGGPGASASPSSASALFLVVQPGGPGLIMRRRWWKYLAWPGRDGSSILRHHCAGATSSASLLRLRCPPAIRAGPCPRQQRPGRALAGRHPPGLAGYSALNPLAFSHVAQPRRCPAPGAARPLQA